LGQMHSQLRVLIGRICETVAAMLARIHQDSVVDRLQLFGVSARGVPHSAAPRVGHVNGPQLGHERHCVRLDSGYVAARAAEIYRILHQDDELKRLVGHLLPRAALRQPGQPASLHLRSFFTYGSPFPLTAPAAFGEWTERQVAIALNINASERLFQACGVPPSEPGFSRLRSQCHMGPLRVVPFSMKLYENEVRSVILDSMWWIGAAVLSLLAYICMHTASLRLGFLAALLIVASLATSFLLNPAFLNAELLMATFLLIGIGADDVLVFYSAWKHVSGSYDHVLGTRRRLREAYYVSVTTLSTTSLTTFISFALFGTLCDQYAVTAFCIYGCIAVSLLWIFSVMWWPACILMIDNSPKGCVKHCCSPVARMHYGDIGRTPPPNDSAQVGQPRLCGNGPTRVIVTACARMLEHRALSVALVATMALVSAYCLAGAVRLQTASGAALFINVFPLDHAYSQVPHLVESFLAADDNSLGSIFCGIEGVDRTGASRLDPRGYRGSPVFAPKFNLATPEAQLGTLALCELLEALSREVHATVVPGSVRCFVRDYLEDCARENMMPVSDQRANCSVSLLDWARMGRSSRARASRSAIGLVNGTMRFLQINFQVPLTIMSTFVDPDSVLAVSARLDAALDAIKPSLPDAIAPVTCFPRMSGAEPAGAFSFAASALYVSQQLTNGAVTAVVPTFVVLLTTTRNLRLALITTISLALTLVTFYGVLAMDPTFRVGTIEIMTGVFAVGYAIDFSIHAVSVFAERRSGARDERDRKRCAIEAIEQAGPAVLSSALSTICAMAAMRMCQAVAFGKMAKMVMTLVGLSTLFTFAFVGPLLSFVG
jgi:hypothetical protein